MTVQLPLRLVEELPSHLHKHTQHICIVHCNVCHHQMAPDSPTVLEMSQSSFSSAWWESYPVIWASTHHTYAVVHYHIALTCQLCSYRLALMCNPGSTYILTTQTTTNLQPNYPIIIITSMEVFYQPV